MALATLTIDIVAKLANLQTGFDRAAQIAERNARRIDGAFKTVSRTVGGVVAGFGLQQAIAAFNRTAEGLAAIKDVSEQTGIAVEELAKLEPVANRAGIALDQVGQISQKLTRALSGIDDESRGAGKALAQIGIDVARFKGLQAADQLQELAKALAQYADDGNKVAVVQGILGRTGAAALPFLKELAEAGQLNARVTREQVEAADRYTKQLADLQQAIRDAARSFTSILLPSVQRTLEELRDGIEVFDGFWAAVRGVGLTNPFLSVGEQVNNLSEKLVDLRRAEAALSQQPPGFRAAQRTLASVREEIALAERQLEYFRRRQASEALQGSGGILDANDARAAAQRSVGAFSLGAEAAGKAAKSVNQLNREISDYANALSREQLDLSNWLGLRDIRDAEESYRNLQRQIERINELTGRGAANKLLEDLKLIDDAFFAGKISVEEYENALRKVAGATDEVAAATEKTRSIADDLGLTFSSAFEDAIVGGKDLRDVLRGLEQDILRIITRKLVTEPLANAIGGINFGSLFGSIFGGQRASGGPVMGGYPYLVGERGPELFVPSQSGQIVPNNQMGRNMVINVNVPASTSGATAQQVAATVARTLAVADARLN